MAIRNAPSKSAVSTVKHYVVLMRCYCSLHSAYDGKAIGLFEHGTHFVTVYCYWIWCQIRYREQMRCVVTALVCRQYRPAPHRQTDRQTDRRGALINHSQPLACAFLNPSTHTHKPTHSDGVDRLVRWSVPQWSTSRQIAACSACNHAMRLDSDSKRQWKKRLQQESWLVYWVTYALIEYRKQFAVQ